MRVLALRCGCPTFDLPKPCKVFDLPAIPTRRDLAPLDDPIRTTLPHDPTPSLDEIAAMPDVAHLGAPTLAPQQPDEPLRIVVVGTDAALSAVLTRLMRIDALWTQIGFIPTAPSTTAENWGLPGDTSLALKLAIEGAVHPVPLIRDDSGTAVAGSATITPFEGRDFVGEVIVDDHVLLSGNN